MNQMLIISKPRTSKSNNERHYIVMASSVEAEHSVNIEGIDFNVSVRAIANEYEEAVQVVENLNV